MCDLSDNINDVEIYYKTISEEKVEAVLGSRFVKKSKVKNYPLFKLFLKAE